VDWLAPTDPILAPALLRDFEVARGDIDTGEFTSI
jgi:hypothetical protein